MRVRERYSPAQCRAARGLLAWCVDELARAARLEAEAVELYEAGEGELAEDELARIGAAFAVAGVIAKPADLAGEGVRFATARPAFPSEPRPRPPAADFDFP